MKLMQATRSSAPAKVILFGEHFVVEGQPAIAAAISLRAHVTVEPADTDGILVYSKNLGLLEEYRFAERGAWSGKMLSIAIAAYTAMESLGRKSGVKVTVDSEIPPGSGMGSSAAVAVATTHATFRAFGEEPDLKEVSRIAFEAEKVVHGKPSGIDNTVATYGGVIAYRKGEGFIPLKAELNGVRLVLADSGVPRNTGEMVKRVLELKNTYPSVLEPLYHAAGRLVVEAARRLEEGDYESLGRLMNVNHGFLSAIGVSTLELEKLVYTARRAGALGSKLTGAGGGGFIVALVTAEKEKEVVEALRQLSPRVFSVEISSEGVRKEPL